MALYYVDMVLDLCLNPTDVSYVNMELLLVKVTTNNN